jgi:hypothetical protein
MFLKDLNHTISTESLADYLEDVNWDDTNRANLNHPTGHWLYDPYEVNQEWKGTPFEDLLIELEQYSIGEARLIKLGPGTCYRSHADIDDRIHLNLLSNDQCYLINLITNEMHKTSADNKIYYMDGSYVHTAANFGSSPRVQLVARVRLSNYDDTGLERIELVFSNRPYNLRYNIDNSVSVLMSQLIKEKNMKFIEFADDRIVVEVNDESLDRLNKELNKLEVQYKVKRGNK